MKEEIIIPVLKEEDFVAATKRRDNYSLTRDIQNQEFNSAIASRLIAENENIIKCAKCGKEFDAGTKLNPATVCKECMVS